MEMYLEVIKQAVIFFPGTAFLFTLPYIIYNYRKYGSVLSLRILIVYSFILYLICAYFLVILPLSSREEAAAMTGPRAQLIPFMFLADIVKESEFVPGRPGTWLTLINNKALFQTVFNILMTVPFGMYLRYYFRFSFRRTVLSAFLLSLFFELTQLSGLYFIYPRGYRLFDVDDLMANTAGGALGYAALKPLLRLLPSRQEIDEASFHRGQTVSLIRRMIAFCCDFLCAGFIAAVLPVFLRPFCRYHWLPWLCFLLYFLFTPVLLKGQTLGKRFMRLRIVSVRETSASWRQYTIRYILFWGIFGFLPVLLLKAVQLLGELPGIQPIVPAIFLALIMAGYCFFVLLEMVRTALHKSLFYERISGTKILSTIRGGFNGL